MDLLSLEQKNGELRDEKDKVTILYRNLQLDVDLQLKSIRDKTHNELDSQSEGHKNKMERI